MTYLLASEHILEGLKIALDNLDEVVALIRNAEDPVTAREGLMDSTRRSVVKAIIWNVMGLAVMALVGLAMTGSLAVGGEHFGGTTRVRMSVGLEDIADILADIEQALAG